MKGPCFPARTFRNSNLELQVLCYIVLIYNCLLTFIGKAPRNICETFAKILHQRPLVSV